jgi:hypothetical protein
MLRPAENPEHAQARELRDRGRRSLRSGKSRRSGPARRFHARRRPVPRLAQDIEIGDAAKGGPQGKAVWILADHELLALKSSVSGRTARGCAPAPESLRRGNQNFLGSNGSERYEGRSHASELSDDSRINGCGGKPKGCMPRAGESTIHQPLSCRPKPESESQRRAYSRALRAARTLTE